MLKLRSQHPLLQSSGIMLSIVHRLVFMQSRWEQRTLFEVSCMIV